MEALPLTPRITELCLRYVWWKSPQEAVRHPRSLTAQIMALGTWDDTQIALEEIGEDRFRAVLNDPPPGIFHFRSWDYWHHKFGISPIPDMPKRRIF